MVGGHTVFQAMCAAGIEGHVAADRANRLTGRIWGVIETVGRGGGGDGKIDDSRFNDGGTLQRIKVQNAVEPIQGDDDASRYRQGTTR